MYLLSISLLVSFREILGQGMSPFPGYSNKTMINLGEQNRKRWQTNKEMKIKFVIALVYFVDCMCTHEPTVAIREFWDLMHLQLCWHSCAQLLDPKRANGQSHAHVLRLTQNHARQQTESAHKTDWIQPEEKENPQHPSQF